MFTLADTIRARRMSRGLEREDLARKVGCDVRSIRRWEGGGLPQARYFLLLREALDLTLEQVDALLLDAISSDAPRYRIEGGGYAERLGIGLDTMLERLITLDRHLVGTSASLGVDEALHWIPIFEALPDSWRLLTVSDEIVGYWHFLPLDRDVFLKCCGGRITDSDFRLEHVQSLDLPGVHDMCLSTLLLESAHQDGRTLRLLLQTYCQRLAALAAREVYFERVCASAWTPASTVLCRRLGMHPVGRVRDEAVEVFEGRITNVLEAMKIPEAQLVLDRYGSAISKRHHFNQTVSVAGLEI